MVLDWTCSRDLFKNIFGEFPIISGAVRCVYGEGMPIYRNPFEKGNLYIKFELTFPPNQFANEKQLKVCVT